MKRIISIIFISSLMILNNCSKEQEKSESSQPVPVKTTKVKKEKISPPIHTSGKLSSAKEIKLSFKTPGIIQKIFFDEGNSVKKGKVLAKLEFAEPVSLFTPESIVDVVKEIKKRFPISEQSTASLQDIKVSNQGVESSKTEFPEWVFHGVERTKSLKVNQLFIEVLLTRYTSEDDFRMLYEKAF